MCSSSAVAEPPLPTGSSPRQCSVPAATGGEAGTGACCHGLGEKPLSLLSRELCQELGVWHPHDQVAWKEGTSPGSASVRVRDAGAGEVLSPVV